MKFEKMLEKVADELDLPANDIIGESRVRSHSEARQILYLLLDSMKKEHPGQIAKRFNRHRTTVINGLEQASGLLEVDRNFKMKYERCKAAIDELPKANEQKR